MIEVPFDEKEEGGGKEVGGESQDSTDISQYIPTKDKDIVGKGDKSSKLKMK